MTVFDIESFLRSVLLTIVRDKKLVILMNCSYVNAKHWFEMTGKIDIGDIMMYSQIQTKPSPHFTHKMVLE